MDILREDETPPSAYPDPPDGLSTAAAALDSDALWKRLESWVTRRWPVRSVQWVVEGCGGFVPRLTPATQTKAESWNGSAWEDFTPMPGPLGVELRGGMYRLTYDVGEATPPAPVLEAYRRLAEYLAQAQDGAGMTSVTDGDYSQTRGANAMGRALQLSGAADLLRAYR